MSVSNSKLDLVFPARVAVCITLLVIFLGSHFGRYLERSYPAFIALIPHIGILIFLALGFFLLRSLKSNKKETSISTEDLNLAILATALLANAAVTASEELVIFPIERIHFLKYSSLAFFIFYSLNEDTKRSKWLIAGSLALITGVFEECMQLYIPERVFDWRDIFLNLCGCVLGLGIVGVFKLWRQTLS